MAIFVGVIGGGTCSSTEAEMAQIVGRELAARGAVLICGGLSGVMEAACKGAKERGGQTIGILPGNSADDANPYVDYPIVTGMGEMRNVIIIKSSRVIIAVGGEFGTLSEIGHALKNRVPVIGLNTWELSKQGRESSEIIRAQDPVAAVEKAMGLIET